ncbi:alpha/beta fold hydrolase [Streptomyces noursei]|uniref:alpha/beta fold hydrolase n=1 Tax=Streptomyces noursei TaxID=1971 RepID=UPI001988553E|nr:hypothetical protein [Streptomyces noursei]MCZ1013815.1 hypothetical protein [Streptomyces noursei]GGX33472.1 hypothetical protein GCM10010341_63650 [Streptomyces noursei]
MSHYGTATDRTYERAGARSPVVTAAGAQEARASLPSAAVTAVPDAGHMLFWDNPPAALAALRAALRPMVG